MTAINPKAQPKMLRLDARRKRRLALLLTLERQALQDPALEPVVKCVRQLYCADVEATKRRDLDLAERKDKGVILWEVFWPRTRTPLSVSIWDQPRQVTRTPHRVLIDNEYVTKKAEWQLATEDAWAELRRELDRPRLEGEALRQYERDLDESWRRNKLRSTWLVKDDTDHVHEVWCESADEAKRRVQERLGGPYVVDVREQEEA